MEKTKLELANKIQHNIEKLKMAQRCLLEGKRLCNDETWFGGIGSLASESEELRMEVSEVLKKYQERYENKLAQL